MLKRVRRVLSLMAAAMLVAPIGCTALPDVRPFATSSREFASAVKVAGRAISQDLRSDEELAEKAEEFDAAWAFRVKEMEGVTRHADGLVAIVQATQDARAKAQALGDSLATLAGTAGFVNPAAGAAADLVIRGASLVYAQIALVRGAASLEEAMVRAQPVIDAVCEKIIADSQDMEEIVASIALLRRGTITSQGGGKARYHLNQMEQYRDQARGSFWKAQELVVKAEAALAGASDDARPGAMQRLHAARQEVAASRESLVAADQLVTTALAENEAYNAAYARAVEQGRAGQELIEAMRTGLSRWADAHRDVAQALRDRRPVSVESLTSVALEVRELYVDFKQLRDAKR
ncbi:MAG TPA: hypothetical protein VF777_12605 [Phycisphaerales bacterium]